MATDKKETRQYNYIKAHYVIMVVDKCKTDKEAGKLIGCSASCVGTARRSGEATEMMENAAKGVWLQKFAPKNSNDNPLMILAVDPSHHATIRAIVSNLGGSVMDVDTRIAGHKGRLAV